jgi:DNA-3-methyladenine glycosylase I
MSNSATRVGPDGVRRCWWALADPFYVGYHDDEWGFPVTEDRTLFEKLCLEGFQAGLSWLTILRKRPGFREAFSQFDIDAVAGFTDADVERLVADPGIVRHRGKIASTVNNARRAVELRQEAGSLAAFVWRFEPSPPAGNGRQPIPSQTAESRALSADLKRRGWSFVGPTTVYAFMQAMGLVNDHLVGCWRRQPAETARRELVRPASDSATARPTRAISRQGRRAPPR